MDLTLNNPQWLMCHKTKPNQHIDLKKNIVESYIFGKVHRCNFLILSEILRRDINILNEVNRYYTPIQSETPESNQISKLTPPLILTEVPGNDTNILNKMNRYYSLTQSEKPGNNTHIQNKVNRCYTLI